MTTALYLLAAMQASAAPVATDLAIDLPPGPQNGSIADYVRQASLRFNIPEPWIISVMQTESAGNVQAVSPKGALGLMQLMPGTWANMRDRHGLGADVFDPRDNILAGTAYLRFLYDRYGKDGFIAAYNAGPGRFEDHLHTGTALPKETRIYVTKVYQRLGVTSALPTSDVPPPRLIVWQNAPLFANSPPADAGGGNTPALLPAPSGPFISATPTGLSPNN